MWSFVTHAGAGMAIAGLTATYYVLSRINYQGERERMTHEQGFGDGPQVNRLRKHNENGHLSSSNMLLKKELEELSSLQGSGSGLNIIYQQKNPMHRLYQSNFEISPIISRVDTRPSSIYSPSEGEEEEVGIGSAATTSRNGSESVFGIESSNNGDKSNLMNSDDGGGGGDSSKTEQVIVSDELLNLPTEDDNEINTKSVKGIIIDEKAGGDGTTTTTDYKNEMYAKDVDSNLQDEMMDINENEWEDVPSSASSNVTQSESVASKQEKQDQETHILKRTPSPVCFFKNPGFGNRFAVVNVKKKSSEKQPSPLVARLSASKLNAEAEAEQQGHSKTVVVETPREEIVQLSPSVDTCQKNSTQFILSPELSKSNVSMCEAENPEKLLKRRKKLKPDDNSAAAAADPNNNNNSTVVDTNPIKEMSEYNKTIEKKVNNGGGDETGTEPRIRLRVDPENANFCPPLKRVVRPVIRTRPSELDSDKGQQNKDENIKAKVNNCEYDETEKSEEENNETVVHCEANSKQDEDKNDIKNTFSEKEMEAEVDNNNEVSKKPLVPPPPSQYPISSNCVLKVGSISTRTSSLIGDIPNDSWIALPVRVYNNAMRTLPWPLIGFCVCVVIVAGFLGIFLTKLADTVSHRHYHQDGKL